MMKTLPPVVMIHGMWCVGDIWSSFRQPFEAAGYTVYTPTLRHHASGAPHPELGTTSLRDYVDDLANFIHALPERPILIGHSMGGLLTQLLVSKGLAKAAILVCSAPPRGVFPIRLSMLPATTRIFSTPGFWKKPCRLNKHEARYAVFNVIDENEAVQRAADFVYESGRAASEIVLAMFQPHGAASVDFNANATPLLSIAGGRDRIVPSSVCIKNAQQYGQRCTYREYPQHGHFIIGEPGWQHVANDCLAWMQSKA